MDATEAMLPDGWKMEAVVARAETEPLENALALVKRQILRIENKLDGERLHLRQRRVLHHRQGQFTGMR